MKNGIERLEQGEGLRPSRWSPKWATAHRPSLDDRELFCTVRTNDRSRRVTAVDILEDVAPPIEGTVPSIIGAGVATTARAGAKHSAHDASAAITEEQEQGTPLLADMLSSQKGWCNVAHHMCWIGVHHNGTVYSINSRTQASPHQRHSTRSCC